jgi:hypothetical protein
MYWWIIMLLNCLPIRIYIFQLIILNHYWIKCHYLLLVTCLDIWKILIQCWIRLVFLLLTLICRESNLILRRRARGYVVKTQSSIWLLINLFTWKEIVLVEIHHLFEQVSLIELTWILFHMLNTTSLFRRSVDFLSWILRSLTLINLLGLIKIRETHSWWEFTLLSLLLLGLVLGMFSRRNFRSGSSPWVDPYLIFWFLLNFPLVI